MNNVKLRKNFRKKNYIYCINIIESEIANKLTNKVRYYNPSYKFTDLKDLKINCYKYLDNKEKICSALLYKYSKEKQPLSNKLYNLLDLYSKPTIKRC